MVEREQRPSAPRPLKAEIAKIQAVLDALEECPPLWWADRLVWWGVRWFYRMRQIRVKTVWDDFLGRDSQSGLVQELKDR